MIERCIQQQIEEKLFKGKAIILFGPRQCGKSTLIRTLLGDLGQEWFYMNGDNADVREVLSNTTATKLQRIIGNKKIVFIDEAQRIPDIEQILKLFADQITDKQVIVTSSLAFELSSQPNEPQTARRHEFMLYPLSFAEMAAHDGFFEEKRLIEHRMIYGYYPEIVTRVNEEGELLGSLAGNHLYKDLLMLEQVKKPLVLEKLLKALALRVGSEINYLELGEAVGSDGKTVDKYIDLLESAFVVFRLPALNRNVKNEIKKGKKVYFYDFGVRNAILNSFKPLSERTDTRALWENYVIAERLKFLRNSNNDAKLYFWRTTQQQEIALIEEHENGLKAFVFKWKKSDKVRFPQTFKDNYPGSENSVISPETIEDFLLG